MFQPATLADLPAFLIGHAQNVEAGTGCTAVVAPSGAVCGVDVRGGGPATRETDLLRPENMVQKVHAVMLSGGSAFGLEASCGAMDALAQRGIGFEVAGQRVPIVTGACIFDLAVGKPEHPDKAMGHLSVERAFAGDDVVDGQLNCGNIGAGCGATVGKLGLPQQAMKSGFGCAFLRLGPLVVGAAVAVNALGCVRDRDGKWIAGVHGADGAVMDPLEAFAAAAAAAQQAGAGAGAAGAPAGAASPAAGGTPCTNTTIGCVLTNAALTKAQATKTASVAHDAYARAIKPVHTQNDGDAIFCMASGEVDMPHDLVSVIATEAMQAAIENAVLSAKGAYGLAAASEL